MNCAAALLGAKKVTSQAWIETPWTRYCVSWIAYPEHDLLYMHIFAGYTMAKGDEWGQPITEEALICQGNEKCYSYRRRQ